MSPAQHQIHHSDDAQHHDRNFGTILSLWDWLWGSLFTTTSKRPPLRFGLGTQAPTGMVAALLLPFVQALRLVSARHALGALVIGALLLSGCEEKKPLDRVALLRGWGTCAVSSYDAFAVEAQALAQATSAAATDPAQRSAAQQAWTRAIDKWHIADTMQIGPAAAAPAAGAQNLRESIYSWPDVNRCLIEQQLIYKTYEGDLFAAIPANTRGLGALEYLLFYDGVDNACPATVPINMNGAWAALSPTELAQRKADYAKAAAANLVDRTQALITVWNSGFLDELVTAGRGSRTYASQIAGINAVSDALFHLELAVKDQKLAPAIGLRECTTGSCPERLESPWARRARPALVANLAGWRKLFAGCQGSDALGFDDLLTSAGAGTLATRMSTDLSAIEASLQAISDDSLAQTLLDNKSAVVGVHDNVKKITDVLKAEFILALGLMPPGRVAGDTD